MKLIYVDTSVFGGKFDVEFELWTELFFKEIIKHSIKIVLSDVAEDELKGAPNKVKEFIETIPKGLLVNEELTEEAILLAEKYLDEQVVGETSRTDCYHIALATVLKVDILVSWNFKHIVNIQRIKGYNSVNLKNDYRMLEIRNPREIFNYEDIQ